MWLWALHFLVPQWVPSVGRAVARLLDETGGISCVSSSVCVWRECEEWFSLFVLIDIVL